MGNSEKNLTDHERALAYLKGLNAEFEKNMRQGAFFKAICQWEAINEDYTFINLGRLYLDKMLQLGYCKSANTEKNLYTYASFHFLIGSGVGPKVPYVCRNDLPAPYSIEPILRMIKNGTDPDVIFDYVEAFGRPNSQIAPPAISPVVK